MNDKQRIELLKNALRECITHVEATCRLQPKWASRRFDSINRIVSQAMKDVAKKARANPPADCINKGGIAMDEQTPYDTMISFPPVDGSFPWSL